MSFCVSYIYGRTYLFEMMQQAFDGCPENEQAILYAVHANVIIMRQGRGSQATEAVFCLQAKKPLPSGSYERRVPKIKIKIIFLYKGCLSLCDSTS